MIHSRHSRHQLLGGISSFILASLLLSPAANAQTRQIDSEGRVTVTTSQRSQDAPGSAVALDSPARVRAGIVTDTSVTVSDDTALSSATANSASSVVDSLTQGGPLWPASVRIGVDAVDAEGSIIAVDRQKIQRSPVQADASRSAVSIETGALQRGHVTVSSNRAQAEARGNDFLATLATAAAGGGIATLQGTDGSQVRASQNGIVTLAAASAADSDMKVTGNRQTAIATSNLADASLDAAGALTLFGSSSPTTLVDGDGTVTANAANMIAQSQTTTGPAIASVGNVLPSGSLLATGATTGSALTLDDNSLSAAAASNQATTLLAVDNSTISGTGPAAAAVNFQQTDGQVNAATSGRTQISASGPVTGSQLSASGNANRATAAGNSSGIIMDVHAASISTSGLPGSGPVGTALVEGDTLRSTTAAFAAHADQRSGGVSINASTLHGGVLLDLAGPIAGSTIDAAGNKQGASAIANDSGTTLRVAAPAFASSADLLSSQSSDTNVATTVGQGDDFAGVTISPAEAIFNSRIAIQANATDASSIGNRAVNALGLTAASAADGGGHDRSRAGTLGTGYGASATLALSSVQKVGLSEDQPVIASNVSGRFAVTGNGNASTSSIDVSGNRQSAGAIANTADNSLSLSATSPGDAGTALSSSQFGAATVYSISAARFVAPGSAEHSDVRIGDNLNQAMAAMNEAANRLDLSTVSPGATVPAAVGSDTLGGASSEGQHVLNNAQFAIGSVSAAATTLHSGSTSVMPAQSGLADAVLRIQTNRTTAEASGNRASNELVLDGPASGGIASGQMNVATIGASALGDAYLSTPRPDQRIAASTVSINGNEMSALARGNLAENSLTASRFGADAPVQSQISGFETRALAPAAITSTQTNYGSVSATAGGSGFSLPLNGSGIPVTGSQLGVTGNTVSATAYANGVLNTVSVPAGSGSAATAIVSSQYNYAPVAARASGGGGSIVVGPINRADLTLTGNSVIASATGNIATNLIGTPR